MRHYDVSRYLLDHYHPLLHSHGFLVFARNGAQTPPLSEVTSKLDEPAQTTDLYFRTFPCDWGYAPDFLTIHPQSESGAVTLRPENGVLRVPTALPTRYGWLEIRGASTFKRTIFELSDRPAANVDEPARSASGHAVARTRSASRSARAASGTATEAARSTSARIRPSRSVRCACCAELLAGRQRRQ